MTGSDPVVVDAVIETRTLLQADVSAKKGYVGKGAVCRRIDIDIFLLRTLREVIAPKVEEWRSHFGWVFMPVFGTRATYFPRYPDDEA